MISQNNQSGKFQAYDNRLFETNGEYYFFAIFLYVLQRGYCEHLKRMLVSSLLYRCIGLPHAVHNGLSITLVRREPVNCIPHIKQR
jgi:hypothetical protein